MNAGPRIDSYEWSGGREAMLRFGPEDGPIVVLALPLFEEANRTRAFGVSILRALAARGIGGVLPDLPGQGESLLSPADVTVLDMQVAYEAAVGQAGATYGGFGVAIRSGALLDALGSLAGRWHLAPQAGADLLRELRRMYQAMTDQRLPEELWWFDGALPADAPDLPVVIAGNSISAGLLTDLIVKTPSDQPGIPRRVVRLASDPREAELKLDAAPPWRGAEPGNDLAFAQKLADDIAQWIARCAA